MANKALQQGKKKAKEDYESRIAEALIGGAGAAHKIVSRDSALPPLRLCFKLRVNGEISYATDPIKVAELYTKPWCEEWKAYDKHFNNNIVKV